jgi:hypothetical protein
MATKHKTDFLTNITPPSATRFGLKRLLRPEQSEVAFNLGCHHFRSKATVVVARRCRRNGLRGSRGTRHLPFEAERCSSD